MSRKNLLVVCSRADLATPSSFGLISDKLDPYIQHAMDEGWRVKVVFNPGSQNYNGQTPYDIVKYPWIVLRGKFLTMVRFLFRGVIGRESLTLGALKSNWRQARCDSWAGVLEKLSPALVIGIGLMGELVEQSRMKGIPTVEVQHGLFQSGDLERYWSRSTPDMFFAWDSFSSEIARTRGMESFVTGHPIAEQFWKSSQQNQSMYSATLERQQMICFSLSWEEEGTVDPFFTMKKELVILVDRVIKLGYVPVFRLHPVTSNNRVLTLIMSAWLKRKWPLCVVNVPRNTSLSETVIDCIGMVTFSSSTALEFGVAGKPSLVLDADRRSTYINVFSSIGLPSTLLVDDLEGLFHESREDRGDSMSKFTGRRIIGEIFQKVQALN
jgi:hypothetical protein